MPEEKEQEALKLRELQVGDKVSRLKVGMDFIPLSIFLKKSAHAHQAQHVSKTYVFTNPDNKVVAYISLICAQIELSDQLIAVEDYPGNAYPAVKIGKLAVDVAYRDLDLGTKLVELSLAIAKQNVQPHVGCRFLAVDSHQQAIPFYEKKGFRLLETDQNKARAAPLMFIDLAKI
jgi:ribosomal protein S18 acetylase RimI-like enzyme